MISDSFAMKRQRGKRQRGTGNQQSGKRARTEGAQGRQRDNNDPVPLSLQISLPLEVVQNILSFCDLEGLLNASQVCQLSESQESQTSALSRSQLYSQIASKYLQNAEPQWPKNPVYHLNQLRKKVQEGSCLQQALKTAKLCLKHDQVCVRKVALRLLKELVKIGYKESYVLAKYVIAKKLGSLLYLRHVGTDELAELLSLIFEFVAKDDALKGADMRFITTITARCWREVQRINTHNLTGFPKPRLLEKLQDIFIKLIEKNCDSACEAVLQIVKNAKKYSLSLIHLRLFKHLLKCKYSPALHYWKTTLKRKIIQGRKRKPLMTLLRVLIKNGDKQEIEFAKKMAQEWIKSETHISFGCDLYRFLCENGQITGDEVYKTIEKHLNLNEILQCSEILPVINLLSVLVNKDQRFVNELIAKINNVINSARDNGFLIYLRCDIGNSISAVLKLDKALAKHGCTIFKEIFQQLVDDGSMCSEKLAFFRQQVEKGEILEGVFQAAWKGILCDHEKTQREALKLFKALFYCKDSKRFLEFATQKVLEFLDANKSFPWTYEAEMNPMVKLLVLIFKQNHTPAFEGTLDFALKCWKTGEVIHVDPRVQSAHRLFNYSNAAKILLRLLFQCNCKPAFDSAITYAQEHAQKDPFNALDYFTLLIDHGAAFDEALKEACGAITRNNDMDEVLKALRIVQKLVCLGYGFNQDIVNALKKCIRYSDHIRIIYSILQKFIEEDYYQSSKVVLNIALQDIQSNNQEIAALAFNTLKMLLASSESEKDYEPVKEAVLEIVGKIQHGRVRYTMFKKLIEIGDEEALEKIKNIAVALSEKAFTGSYEEFLQSGGFSNPLYEALCIFYYLLKKEYEKAYEPAFKATQKFVDRVIQVIQYHKHKNINFRSKITPRRITVLAIYQLLIQKRHNILFVLDAATQTITSFFNLGFYSLTLAKILIDNNYNKAFPISFEIIKKYIGQVMKLKKKYQNNAERKHMLHNEMLKLIHAYKELVKRFQPAIDGAPEVLAKFDTFAADERIKKATQELRDLIN